MKKLSELTKLWPGKKKTTINNQGAHNRDKDKHFVRGFNTAMNDCDLKVGVDVEKVGILIFEDFMNNYGSENEEGRYIDLGGVNIFSFEDWLKENLAQAIANNLDDVLVFEKE